MASRRTVILAGSRAGVAIGAIGATLACTPARVTDDTSPGYVLCNTAGCGDNIAIVIDKNK